MHSSSPRKIREGMPSPHLQPRTPDRERPTTPFRRLGLAASIVMLVVMAALVVAVFVAP